MFKNTKYRINWRSHMISGGTLLTFSGLLFLFITFTALCGRRLAPYFSLQYNSVWSLLSFFLVFGLLKFPMSALVSVVPRTIRQQENLSARRMKLLRMICNAFSTTVVIVLVDYFMDSVHVPDLTTLSFAFFFSVADLYLNSDENDRVL